MNGPLIATVFECVCCVRLKCHYLVCWQHNLTVQKLREYYFRSNWTKIRWVWQLLGVFGRYEEEIRWICAAQCFARYRSIFLNIQIWITIFTEEKKVCSVVDCMKDVWYNDCYNNGHVQRMNGASLPKRILNAELPVRRKIGGKKT